MKMILALISMYINIDSQFQSARVFIRLSVPKNVTALTL